MLLSGLRDAQGSEIPLCSKTGPGRDDRPEPGSLELDRLVVCCAYAGSSIRKVEPSPIVESTSWSVPL